MSHEFCRLSEKALKQHHQPAFIAFFSAWFNRVRGDFPWRIELAKLLTIVLAAGLTVPTGTADAQERWPVNASELPLKFSKGEKVAFVGNSLAERFGLFGHFEAELHARFPELELQVRSFARPAETVSLQQRSADYTKIDDPQAVFSADTYFCFFGFNESFSGPGQLENFRVKYHAYLDQLESRYPRGATAGSKPRFVLVSPIAFEAPDSRFLPKGSAENQHLRAYSEAVGQVAAERKLAFVDLFSATEQLFSQKPGLQFTINGCHLNFEGDREIGALLNKALFGESELSLSAEHIEPLRQAVVDKAWVHQQDYRKVNGWYVYGGRRTWDTETFPLEYKKIRNMVAVRDQEIWAVAQGKKSQAEPDDSQTGELHTPTTRFGNPSQKYSESDELKISTPDEFIAQTEVPEGFRIELFADETMFPELANPVQANFDNRGRLWVACMPTYPQWKPGEPKPNDKLLIFEDLDQDGKADRCKVFYDKLHCPTGFEFWNGGVLVVDQPRILFLQDTTGDDRADVVVHLLDGWATDDTHHTCSSFQWNNASQLHMLEGIATSTTLETPWGPHLSNGSGGAYVLDPKSLKIRQFSLPGQYNMWSYSFDQWGQGFPGDGTTCNQAWDTPLSGASFSGRKGIRFVVDNEGMRPGMGNEFLISRHFPDEVQGQLTYSCVINMNGLPRFSFGDDGGGYSGKRLKKPDGSPDDLIRSNDKHFRPGVPQIGPDGALWFVDWCNALVGHMQYSQRDPNRDKSHGRIYRLVYPSRPLVDPVTQYGKSVPEILAQLRAYEWRTRYRARRELLDRPWSEIEPALKHWWQTLPNDDDVDRLRCEVLWIQESHHQLDLELLSEVALQAERFEARAAAIHLIADARERVATAESILVTASQDPHPRVRTEVARGLSFFPTTTAMRALFEMLQLPADYWADYTIYHALGANKTVWMSDFLAGRMPHSERGAALIAELFASSELDQQAFSLIADSHRSDFSAEQKNKAMTSLANLSGGIAGQGHEIFKRNCANCHLIGNEGRDFGPNLSDAGKRLSRYKLIESIVHPNAELEEKYRTTMVLTLDGEVISGLLVSETEEVLELYDGTETKKILIDDVAERTTKAQSSMPDDLAVAMSPSEFIHLIEFLSTLQQAPVEKEASELGEK